MSDTVEFAEPLPRETGEERSGQFCAECGTELPLVTTPYRSTHAGACPVCTAGAQLEAQKAAADVPLAQGEQEPEKGAKRR